MRALLPRPPGSFELLGLEDVAEPEPGPGEVCVRLSAAPLTARDVRGGWEERAGRPRIAGAAGAGCVESVGVGVRELVPGDAVIVAPGLSCGRCVACGSGRDHLCRQRGWLGEQREGTFAERVAVPAANALPRPPALSAAEAAALPYSYHCAWHAVVGGARLRRGQTLLLFSAGCGISVAALQIADRLGARVLAVADCDEAIEGALGLGAEAAIHTCRGDVGRQVARWTGRRGVQAALDPSGGAELAAHLACLAPGGRAIVCAGLLGGPLRADLSEVADRQLGLIGSGLGGRGELAEVLAAVERGDLHPVVQRAFPLARVERARRALERGRGFGEIVLTMEESE